MGECVSVCFKSASGLRDDFAVLGNEPNYATPTTVEQYRQVQTKMDCYTKTVETAQTDVKREFNRLKTFICDSTYPELQPDRESDWHCKEHCEVRCIYLTVIR